jgi:hypothetical protein
MVTLAAKTLLSWGPIDFSKCMNLGISAEGVRGSKVPLVTSIRWKAQLGELSDFLPWMSLAVVTCLGAWARWRYLQAGVFHVDEFISMLAIQMILAKGQPVLPSGLYYDNGLVFSYFGAGVAYLTGGDLLAARWWSLAMGVFTIVLVYVLSWQLFGTRWWGLAAAAAMALFPDAIEWGGRVRMYSQANVMLLAWMLLAWWGTLGGGRRWARWGLIGSLWLGLNTHFILILAVIPLALSLLIVGSVAGSKKVALGDSLRHFAVDVGVALVVLVLSVWMAWGSFIARYAVESAASVSAPVVAGTGLLNSVLDVALSGTRWTEIADYFWKDRVFPFAVLSLMGAVVAVMRAVRKRLDKTDLAGLFVTLLLASILAETLLLLPDEWRKMRYNFLLVFPLMLPLSVYSLHSIVNSIVLHIPDTRYRIRQLCLVGVVALGFFWPLSGFWDRTIEVITGTTRTPNRYNLAFEYVDKVRMPDDQLLSIRPEAGYLFSKRLDYYANQTTAVIVHSSKGWIDRYAGVPYLADVGDLNRILDMPGTLWFVVDTERLFEHFAPGFTQQVLQRMTLERSLGNVLVLRENEGIWPLAEMPEQKVTAVLDDTLQLSGYTLSNTLLFSPGETSYLTLFWQADERLLAYKVFLHLRDDTGNTVAQADFIPLETVNGKLRPQLIAQAREGFLRLGTTLSIPLDIPPGKYTLWTGLYEAASLQRLPVVNDTSGENAVLLGEVTITAKETGGPQDKGN